MIRHLPPTQLLLTICAGCACALPSLQHAMQGCKPQSVKSCGPRALAFHVLRFTNADLRQDVSFAPVSYKVGCKTCFFLAGAKAESF